MTDTALVISALLHVLVDRARDRVCPADDRSPGDERDRGAVSIEQVLWYAAAAVSVAVIAAIIWSQIRNDASNVTVNTPSAP